MINKYITVGLGAICAFFIIYCLLLRNDRDSALNKIDGVVAANTSLQRALSNYKREQEAAQKYITNLEISKQETDNKYTREVENFKHAKKSNETIDIWSNTKLPSRLYQ